MGTRILASLKAAAMCVAAVVALSGNAAFAHDHPHPHIHKKVVGQVEVPGERYIPTIWVDPDGCEHWVMDDGAEGYMSPHVTRAGIPVCRRGNVCGTMPADQLFATDSATVSSAGRAKLQQFFQSTNARGFIVEGHTDSRASDSYNMALSQRRANAVASVGKSVGATIYQINGYGERKPRASNATAAGMQQNRRVEIICVK